MARLKSAEAHLFSTCAMANPSSQPPLLETDGLPEYEGPHSLIDALLSPGGLVGMRLRECRALATLSKHWKMIVNGQEVWRLCCAMLAREHHLCALF